MTVLHIFCAAFLFSSIKAHCIPVISPCQPEIITMATPVIGTTTVDNSVSNALANALQLLIVSNLIENTIISNPVSCPNSLPTTLVPLCDTIPIQPSLYPPIVDVLVPEYVPSLPYNLITPCDHMIAPCDRLITPRDRVISPCDRLIAPCEPALDVIPNSFYSEILPSGGYNCGCDILIPDCSCNSAPNCGCRINKNCNCGYVVPEYVYPSSVGYEYGYGNPGSPLGVTVEPWCHESYHKPCYGNLYK